MEKLWAYPAAAAESASSDVVLMEGHLTEDRTGPNSVVLTQSKIQQREGNQQREGSCEEERVKAYDQISLEYQSGQFQNAKVITE